MRCLALLCGMLALLCCLPHLALAQDFGEAPSLRQLVRAGRLPQVAMRLPLQPLVVQPQERMGRYGGTWRMGMRGNRDHALLLRTLGYENLVRWSPTWQQTLPNIAALVTHNEDFSKYTVHLRKGMRWSDGHRFTAEDILFWYHDVLRNPELTQTPPPWLEVAGVPVVVDQLDEYTVEFRFAAPYGLFLRHLAHPQGAEPISYPKHYLRQFHPAYSPATVDRLMLAEGHATWQELFLSRFGLPGTVDHPSRWRNPALPTLHAWVLEQPYTPQATCLTATRNPYYWKIDPLGNQLPYIDRLQFTVGDRQQVEDWAADGLLDMQNRHLVGAALGTRLQDAAAAGRIRLFRTTPGRSSDFVLMLNLTHPDPALRQLFQELRFRKALSHALDRQRYSEVVYGAPGTPCQGAPRPESVFYDAGFATQYTTHDPALAARLLDELGCRTGPDGLRRRPDGGPLRIALLTEAPYVQMHAQLADMWRAVGLDARIEGLDREHYEDAVRRNTHDAVIAAGEGGLDVLLEHQHYLPVHEDCFFGVAWRRWWLDPADPLAQKPPQAVQRQFMLYDSLKATGEATRQRALMQQILHLAAEQFFVMGLTLDQEGYGVISPHMANVPGVMPYAWSYPTPAPTNPCQYFFEQPSAP